MFRLKNVGKRFRDGDRERWVLRDVTMDIDEGEVVALWGPSGSGKSTLLNILAGLILPDEGSVDFEADGEELAIHLASEKQRVLYRRRNVGFVFQFFNLVPTLTIRENIELPLELTGRMAVRTQALARLEKLGVAGRAHAFPASLSGGEQQRVAIARALAHNPRVLLADEPTGNLDAENAERVVELLWREVEEAGSALVIASHSERVLARATRVVELSA